MLSILGLITFVINNITMKLIMFNNLGQKYVSLRLVMFVILGSEILNLGN